VGAGRRRQGRHELTASTSPAGDLHPPERGASSPRRLRLSRDRLYGHVTKKKGRTEFLAFCRYLRSLHPPEVRIAIVLDNFVPHLSTKKDPRVGDLGGGEQRRARLRAWLRMGWASRLIRSVSRSLRGRSLCACRWLRPSALRTKSVPPGLQPRCGSKEERALNDPNQECPSRSHQRDHGGTDDSDDRCRPAQGDAHSRRHRRRRTPARGHQGPRHTQAGVPAVGVGRAVRDKDLGDRVRRRARLSPRAAARRCRRDGRGRLSDAGVESAAARLGPQRQERPERRPVRRGRRAAVTGTAPGPGGGITARCCGSWRSGTSTLAATEPGSRAASPPRSPR
jgi:hypothetical protein